jgi:anti-sigma regulatory factor (Ser/Thr protein kinase)
MEPHAYAFELKNDLSELETLYRHLDQFRQRSGLSEGCVTDVNVCLDELFTNIVSYGFKDDQVHMTQFTMNLDNGVLKIVIEDEGIPFNPLDKADPEIPDDLIDVKIGGLGIHIVRKLMDDLHYERKRGRNKLTLVKNV